MQGPDLSAIPQTVVTLKNSVSGVKMATSISELKAL